MNINNLNLLLHEDYVTKVVCREPGKGKYSHYPFNKKNREWILESVTYLTENIVGLSIHPLENKVLSTSISFWLNELYVSMPKDNPRVYLYIRDSFDQSCKLQLEFYLLSKAEVNLRTIYDECFFQ